MHTFFLENFLNAESVEKNATFLKFTDFSHIIPEELIGLGFKYSIQSILI
jgi:hypothetical protein